MRTLLLIAAAILVAASAASGGAAGDPIRLAFDEGDVAGFATVYEPGGKTAIGFIEFHQVRRGDVLSCVRVARFRDGSSDEDTAEARVAGNLQTLSGRSVVRDRDGEVMADVTIDVTNGRVKGSWGRGAGRQTLDEATALPPDTYFGPLIFVVLKNFAANAEDDRLVFRTVAPTPRPRVFDLELVRVGPATLERSGASLDTVRFELRPTVHWLVDPIIQRIAPQSSFYMLPGEPPALARFAGPRNYGREAIRIE